MKNLIKLFRFYLVLVLRTLLSANEIYRPLMMDLKSGKAFWKTESNALLLIDKFSVGLTFLKKFLKNLIWDFIGFNLHKRFTFGKKYSTVD